MNGPSSKKKVSQPEPKQDPGFAPKPTPEQDLKPGAAYKKGDFIGRDYEVYEILGKGGFGVVYLVYSHEAGGVLALKTFRDEFLADQEVRKRFHKEARVWVELGPHPFLVHAHIVENIAEQLFILMEYITPNKEGLNSLEGFLQRRPPDLTQSLRWAIQVCHGMEYAYSKGLLSHRDLKPANIIISQDMTAKITDFGLAGLVSELPTLQNVGWGAQPGRIGLSGQTMHGAGFGTPTHMAPEQFDNAAGCDERSDIYSIGIVLYQMAIDGKVPFLAPLPKDGTEQTMAGFWQAMQRLHIESPVPKLTSPLFPIIQRCLEKSPEKRYQTFKELRKDLEPLLKHQTGEVVIPPQLKDLKTWEWENKGVSLASLNHFEEAILCFEKVLALDPCDYAAWNNKGASLDALGRHEEAIRCFDQALELDPRYVDAWYNKGINLESLDRHEDAILCYDKALELDPRCVDAWTNRGLYLCSLHHYEEAFRCFDQALELDPRSTYTWNIKGTSLGKIGRYEEAIPCYDQALELDPCHVNAWYNKGTNLIKLGRYEESTHCFNKAIELNPRYVKAWNHKGICLENLGRYEEAIRCYAQALGLDSHHVNAWYNKALAEDKIGKLKEAILSYQQFLALAPAQYAKQIEYARQRLQELGG